MTGSIGKGSMLDPRKSMDQDSNLKTPSGFSPGSRKKSGKKVSLKDYNEQIEEKEGHTNPNTESINSSIVHGSRNVGEKDDLMMSDDDNELVKLGVDMSQLSDYMDNIVKVVN